MKKINTFTVGFCLLCFFMITQTSRAQGIAKRVQVGYTSAKIVDSGDKGEGSWGWDDDQTFFSGFGEIENEEVNGSYFSTQATFLLSTDWTDTLGQTHSVKTSGHGQWETDDRRVMMPVPDAEGWTIHRYYRNQPPDIIVDGMPLNEPFPMNFSDHIAPDKIPGNADAMVESFINTDMGVSIHQRVFAFSNSNHDKYTIYEWTFKNTGNVNLDADSELPDQTINNFYFLRQFRFVDWPPHWGSSYGEMPDDSLKFVTYAYPQRQEGSDYDGFGYPNEENGFLQAPQYTGQTVLFASKAVNDMVTHDWNQPSMSGFQDCDFESVTKQPLNLTESQIQQLYTLASEGFAPISGDEENDGARPGHHSVRLDDRGYKYSSDAPWFGFTISGFWAAGPYTLQPGDSIKIVWADVFGTISPEKCWEVGQGWINDDLEPPPGMDFDAGIDNLPPVYEEYPELYEEDDYASEYTNWAKDCWVSTGKDSLFRAIAAAQWAWDNDLNVPQAPPAPSISVTSKSDKILVEWGNESEAAPDFAGYRVYRSRGSWLPQVLEEETEMIGIWELVFECGAGTGNALTNEYLDAEPQRGVAYFYTVTALDDGQQNGMDYNGPAGVLESSRYVNITPTPAHLTKPSEDDLSDVVVVPNPYNIKATEMQFPGEQNKIMFLNLPEECTIRIFSESGDLIRTIEHSGSGDEAWGGLPEEHMATSSDQIVVSGIYIAHFQTPEGESTFRKFLIVR